MNALKEVSAPVAAIIYSAEPLWGAGLAWGILGERCALPPSQLPTLSCNKSHPVPVEAHSPAQVLMDAVLHLPCIAAAHPLQLCYTAGSAYGCDAGLPTWNSSKRRLRFCVSSHLKRDSQTLRTNAGGARWGGLVLR